MNGRPRINAGFLVGHHEFHANERRIEKRLLVPPARKIKDKRKSSDKSVRRRECGE